MRVSNMRLCYAMKQNLYLLNASRLVMVVVIMGYSHLLFSIGKECGCPNQTIGPKGQRHNTTVPMVKNETAYDMNGTSNPKATIPNSDNCKCKNPTLTTSASANSG